MARQSAAFCGVGMLVALATAFSCARPPPETPRPQTATEIVGAMVLTYQRAVSYEDHGVVVQDFVGSHSRHADFDTALVRTAGFRFEVRDEWGGSPAVVWTTDGKLHSYRRGGAIEDRTVLGGARFYSEVPSLLLPTLAPKPTLGDLKQLRVDGKPELVDGHSCWRVVGTLEADRDMTLWIDQASYLLRRTVMRVHYPAGVERKAFDAETTTDYRPVLNAYIADARLAGPDPKTLPAARTFPWIGVELAADAPRITRVLAGSPAERARLRTGDEIVSVDQVAIADSPTFVEKVRRTSVGATVTMTIRRRGVDQALAVIVGDRAAYADLQSALINKPAPPFAATVVFGSSPGSLSGLAGSVIVLDFTPPTFVRCENCESPEGTFMSQLQDRYYNRGVRVVGMSTEAPDALKKTAADLQLTYTLAHDDDAKLANEYFVQDPMTVVVIDQAGIVRFIANRTRVESLIEHVLSVH